VRIGIVAIQRKQILERGYPARSRRYPLEITENCPTAWGHLYIPVR
jgi:hypothetical protein